MHKININEKLFKLLKKIPKRDYVKIVEKLEDLKKNPRPRWIEKMANRLGYRVSIGNYRIIFEIDDKEKTLTILAIDDRKDAYKKR